MREIPANPELGRVGILSWADDLEEGAANQAFDIAALPFAFHHVAIMADGHQGFGMPIGGVLATENVVVPNAVGVDIGCGMFAVKTSLYDYDLTPDKLSAIMAGIRNTVPMGVGQHQEAPQEWERFDNPPSLPVIENQLVAARRDLDLNLEQAKMTALGVVGGPRTTRELDEAPGAYKDIDAVMANQTDLVKVVTKLRPLASMKG